VVRPGVHAFLDRLLAEGCLLTIFTAGLQPYADALLNDFDADGAYFGGRRYYRHNCSRDPCRKDLRAIFGDDLSNVTLIDDNAHFIVPADQRTHTIPVGHWRGDHTTEEAARADLTHALHVIMAKKVLLLHHSIFFHHHYYFYFYFYYFIYLLISLE
jgi:TFIIF-interacting CTD phosphatase-like protein